MAVYTRSHIQMLEEIDEGIQYLSALNTRNKWVEEKRNIAMMWSSRWIPATHEGIGLWDGKVRVVRVRMGGKDSVRPITMSCPLEI